MLEGTLPPQVEMIDHGGALPALPTVKINLYAADGPGAPLTQQLAQAVREAYRA
jgi:hypothetical protein